MKSILTILALCLLTSCNNQVENINEAESLQINVEQDSITTTLASSQVKYKMSEPFKIKDVERLAFTSGGISKVIQNKFCDSLSSGFFGTYFLIDQDFHDEIGRPIGGTITVHANKNIKGWRADDTTQTIWEIHLMSDVISVWDSIHVGQTREIVERFAMDNKGICTKKREVYSSCDFNNFTIDCIFKNDTLTELTITRNCE